MKKWYRYFAPVAVFMLAIGTSASTLQPMCASFIGEYETPDCMK